MGEPGAVTVPDDTYTHGHHESVLQAHRWRNAENSAAYLLLPCGLAQRVLSGRSWGWIGRRRRWPRHERRFRAGITNVRFETGDAYRLDNAMPTSTWCTLAGSPGGERVGDPKDALLVEIIEDVDDGKGDDDVSNPPDAQEEVQRSGSRRPFDSDFNAR